MNSERLWLCNAINMFVADILRAHERGTYDFDKTALAVQQIITSAAQVALWERENNAPDCRGEAELLLEQSLEGLTPDQKDLARVARRMVLAKADELVARFDRPEREDDPACLDPGGGMRSLHEIEDDEQF